MTHIVLARHAETVWHGENRYTGHSDVPLTDRGRDQAARLARWAAGAGLRAVFSSGLVRARDTARPCAEAAGLDLRTDPRLRELAFGDAEGLTTEEMRARFPDALAAFHDDPAANPLPGGENPGAAVERGIEAIDDICAQFPTGRVLIVAHTTLIRLLLCRFLGLPAGEYRRTFPSVRNCGLTELLVNGDRVSLLRYNAPAIDDESP